MLMCVLRCEYSHIHGEIIALPLTSPKSKGVKFLIRAFGVAPGYHGIHIHSGYCLKKDGTIGTLSCDGLCDHYNPTNALHGDLNSKNAHRGDLGNVFSNKDRIISTEVVSKLLTLNEIVGRAAIIHEDKDDLGLGNFPDSKTTGHSGKRVLCGIFGILHQE